MHPLTRGRPIRSLSWMVVFVLLAAVGCGGGADDLVGEPDALPAADPDAAVPLADPPAAGGDDHDGDDDGDDADCADDGAPASDVVWVTDLGRGLFAIDPVANTCPAFSLHAAQDVAVGADAVWVVSGISVDGAEHQLVRVDPSSGDVVEDYPLPGADVVEVAGSSVYVASREMGSEPARLHRLDPATGETESVDLGAGSPTELAVTSTDAWVTLDSDDVVRVDLHTMSVVATIDAGSLSHATVVAAGEEVWLYLDRDSDLVRLDQSTNTLSEDRVDLGDTVVPIALSDKVAFAGGRIWVARDRGSEAEDEELLAVDPASGEVTQVLTSAKVVTVAGNDEAVYVIGSDDDDSLFAPQWIAQLDPSSGEELGRTVISEVSYHLAVR